MKIACITTTVHVPIVLQHYRKLSHDVKFFIALDKNSPFDALAKFSILDNASWLTPDYQDNKWKSSKLIGWETDSRRNFALLEALEWGAEIIISLDDDMISLAPNFFTQIEWQLTNAYSGLQLGTHDRWFDAGQYTLPLARQRGLPYVPPMQENYDYVNEVQIGAMQGIILGIADTDAATTVANRPFVTSATSLLEAGFVVDPSAKAVFNSQLTAFRRELAPAFAQFYKWQGRNTDIIASVIMRRVMADRGLYTYYGPPAGFHARTWRDPFKDMKAEMWGVENIDKFTDYLARTDAIPHNTVGSCVGQLRRLYEDLAHCAYFDPANVECALAWLDDCETVL